MSCDDCKYKKIKDGKYFCELNDDFVPKYLINGICVDNTTDFRITISFENGEYWYETEKFDISERKWDHYDCDCAIYKKAAITNALRSLPEKYNSVEIKDDDENDNE